MAIIRAIDDQTVAAPVDHGCKDQQVDLALKVADLEIQPSNIGSAAYDEDPFDNRLNINLSESLVNYRWIL